MRKSFVLIATLAALGLFAGGASATRLTEQQVKNVCGGSLQTGGGGGTTASGCEKKCGDQICTYNCCSGKGCGEQGCHGHVVGRTISGGTTKGPLPKATIREISVIKHTDTASPVMMKTNTMGKTNDSLTTRSNSLSSGSTTTLKKQQDNTLMKR